MTKFLLTASAVTLVATGAFAGGFERSGNPVGFMFEAGNYAELSFGIVSPSVNGRLSSPLLPAPGPSGDVSPTYRQLGFAIKTDLNEKVSLGLSIDPSFGADVSYPNPSPGPVPYTVRGTNAELNGDTLSVIGRYKFNDNFSAHAGLRSVSVGGNVATAVNGNTFYRAGFDTDRDVGYLVGVAYERPEIALRVALTYQSETSHDLATSAIAVAPGPTLIPISATTTVELPKSLTLDFQSGVAADTLVFGSIRWVDWTATELVAPGYPLNPLVSYDDDTITYNIGVGRRFNEQWSGAVSIGYEKAGGGIQQNLSPTDGFVSIGLGATYTTGNVKITGGIRYVDIGNARALENPVGTSNAVFNDNSAIGAGIKIGYTF
jgi:long-chain fatty acid transport protein